MRLTKTISKYNLLTRFETKYIWIHKGILDIGITKRFIITKKSVEFIINEPPEISNIIYSP